MGVWASGSFGNDTALDFVADVTSFAAVLDTLRKLEQDKSALDAEDASIALAACDMLAAAIGRPPADLPDMPSFENEQVSEDLLKTAKTIVKRVRTKSELAELWSEEDDAEWQLELDGLLLRLTPSEPYEVTARKEDPELPEDFLGYCYLCYGMVTERDGINFEYTMPDGGTLSMHPHRKCIETLISGPHWKKDGSPTEKTRRRLMQDMGFEVE
ncbi:DUF4259 domain-containing protein [Roseibium sp. SCPC15]|uniref:DUF4259 domain-containing protein n=1 Tax=Roseibium sp. SCP15 TaxID=3141376 RepID=UPI003339FA2D